VYDKFKNILFLETCGDTPNLKKYKTHSLSFTLSTCHIFANEDPSSYDNIIFDLRQ
jgi:hypothetical protein